MLELWKVLLSKELEMLTQVRAKSQITIPGAIVNRLGIQEGDQLDVTEKDGVIQLVPVAVYPKSYIEQLQAEIAQLKGLQKNTNQTIPNQPAPTHKRIGAGRDLYRGSITLEDFDRDNEQIAEMLMGGDL